MPKSASHQPIQVQLNRDEALVLFELLARSQETNVLRLKRNAEYIAVSALAEQLQSILVEPFNRDYRDVVAQSAARLEVGYEGLAPGVEP